VNGFLKRQMSGFSATYRRELGAYFATPMAYVFLAVFLLALGLFTWEAGRFFDTGVADLQPFFVWHPWLYMIFLPALAMRLWADEKASGTDELLLSLPLGIPGLVLGKLMAAWTVAAAGLLLTLPMWASATASRTVPLNSVVASASAWPRVALLSANVEVRATAPGMLATQ
jgi:ABC-2 type transport system permease protein